MANANGPQMATQITCSNGGKFGVYVAALLKRDVIKKEGNYELEKVR